MQQDQPGPWEALDLEQNPEQKLQAEQARINVKRRFRNAFTTEDGQWVLEYLNGRFFNAPVVNENAVNPLAYAGIREGELRMLRFIHQMIQPEK